MHRVSPRPACEAPVFPHPGPPWSVSGVLEFPHSLLGLAFGLRLTLVLACSLAAQGVVWVTQRRAPPLEPSFLGSSSWYMLGCLLGSCLPRAPCCLRPRRSDPRSGKRTDNKAGEPHSTCASPARALPLAEVRWPSGWWPPRQFFHRAYDLSPYSKKEISAPGRPEDFSFAF